MGSIVAENLKPELEVIHFIATPEAAKQDLPLLLQRKAPHNTSDGGIGTQDYSQAAQAVVLGLGYTNEIVDELRQACHGIDYGVPWLAGGLPKAKFEEVMKNNPPPPPEQYGPATAQKVKSTLNKILKDGRGGRDGIYYWHEH